MEKISFDIVLALKDKISGGLDKVSAAFAEVEKQAKSAAGQSEKFGGICSKLSIPNANAIISIVERITDSMADAMSAGMAFGQSIADLSSITGITGKELEQLEANARKFGQESGLGAGTAARAYSILASQIQVSEIGMEGLNTLQEKSITLAQASGMSLDASAEALAATVNQFGLGADQADRVINVLAAGSKYGAAEISELSQSFKVVGASASAMGLNVESTAGALEVLSKANLKGSEAGTALRNIILKLNTELGIDLGETSLGTALEALKPKLTDATFLSKVFGMENLAAAQFLIQNAESVDQMTATLTGTNVAQEQAATRTQTTAQRMAELRAWVDNVKISITDMTGGLAPYLMLISENAAAMGSMATLCSHLYSGMGKVNQVVKVLTGSTLTHTIAAKAAAAAAKAWTVVQAALNVVLSNNPVGWIVKGILVLAGAVIYCYNHFEGFRKVCDAAWAAVKKIGSAVWDYLVKAFQKASAVIREAWKWVKNFFGIADEADVDAATDALDNQTQSIEENTEAKKKALQIDFGKLGVGTGKGKGAAVGKKGSLSWLENEISQKETKLKLAIDDTSRSKLKKEIDELKHQKALMELELDYPKGSMERIDQEIAMKQAELSLAINDESRRRIQSEIDQLTGEKRTIELTLQYSKPVENTRQQQDMAGMKSHFATAKADTSAITPAKLKVDHKYFNTYEAAVEKARKAQEKFRKGTGAVADAFGSIGNAIGGAAGQWLQYGASVLSAIGQAIPAILTMLGVQTAEEQQSHKNTSANVTEAGSKVLKAHAGIPFVGIALGLAGVAAIIAAMMSIPKFETGGIMGGTSFYGDKLLARVNSGEMILNRGQQARLFGMVNSGAAAQPGGVNGKVTFKIEGRTLKGVLEKENRLTQRS